MSREELERQFPNLVGSNWEPRSKSTYRYNCAAYAIGFEARAMWPESRGPYAWNTAKTLALKSFRLEFEEYGFVVCSDGSFENGFIKIAVYTDDDRTPTHVARQDPDSKMWLSKCGDGEDIIHELDALNGPEPAYGEPALFMKIARDVFKGIYASFKKSRQHDESSECGLS